MSSTNVFSPIAAYSINVTDASGGANITIDGSAPIVRMYTKGAGEVFVSWGNGNQTVTTSAYMVSMPAGSAPEPFNKGPATKMAAVCATGETATLRIVVGVGE
jgi:hypothetical protein